VCAVLSSVCATTVDNSGLYVYYFKGIVSVCFRCPARTASFSGTRLYLCIYILQPTKLSDAQALPTSWLGGSTRGLQPGGHVHTSICLPASITSSGACKPECNDLSQFREDTGRPSMPVREFNLIANATAQFIGKLAVWHSWLAGWLVAVWNSGSALVSTNKVNLCPVRTVLGWVFNSRCRTLISVCNQPPRPTQPSIPPGSVNEDQLRLGRKRQVWFVPLADERRCAGKTVRSLENTCHI